MTFVDAVFTNVCTAQYDLSAGAFVLKRIPQKDLLVVVNKLPQDHPESLLSTFSEKKGLCCASLLNLAHLATPDDPFKKSKYPTYIRMIGLKHGLDYVAYLAQLQTVLRNAVFTPKSYKLLKREAKINGLPLRPHHRKRKDRAAQLLVLDCRGS